MKRKHEYPKESFDNFIRELNELCHQYEVSINHHGEFVSYLEDSRGNTIGVFHGDGEIEFEE